ncbi:Mur ligase family protein [Sneathia sanguinegens]|uniref:Mur ligase family protein n=1 Tax=Sneathia sanguinegens TaxID=40543 RepID=A0ABT7HJL9_9FUSO|nr:Mur ligase family protein [Sneathia sanguinegens]MDK9580698.1 Mur ligase family protein [Sneathia sanguinegens]
MDNKVDIAIIEVGIGGRFDVTNEIMYDYALITNVSLDHTQMLGNTREKIAWQKAGIAKNNTKTFYTDAILKKFVEKESSNTKFLKAINKFKLPLKGDFQQKKFCSLL